jgi:hypothetical protein
MVAASATAILTDINLSTFRVGPQPDRQICAKPCKNAGLPPVLPTYY